MEENKLEELLFHAINASLDAGHEIMKIYESNFEVEFKEDDSPLTLADNKSHDTICSALALFQIPFLSEEGRNISYDERKDWEYLWVIDPLDGTKEFIKKNGEFTVNIALVKNKKPIIGVIYCPSSKDLYFSLVDYGAYKINFQNHFENLNHLISVANKLPLKTDRQNFVVVGSRSHMSKETEEFFQKKKKENDQVEILAVGSSLKICMVAEGSADVYPRYAPTMEWDTGAGDAICRMAGFQVLQYQSNKPVEYNKEDLLNPWFLVK